MEARTRQETAGASRPAANRSPESRKDSAITDKQAAPPWGQYRSARAAELWLLRRHRRSIADEQIESRLKRQRETVQSLRNAIAEHYLPLLGQVSQRVHARLPREVDADMLRADGAFGLLGAIKHFRPQRGCKFETFAPNRIRGAIYDGLRALDWVPRTARTRTNTRRRFIDDFYKSYGRVPYHGELAQICVDNDEHAGRLLTEREVPEMTSLQRPMRAGPDEPDSYMGQTLSDPSAVSPWSVTARRDIRDFLIRHLDRDDQLIVLLYYYEGMSMREVGQTLAISESRVSQKHGLILHRLRARLQDRESELDPEDR